MQVCAIATLADLLDYLATQETQTDMAEHHQRVIAYRQRYGVD